MSYKIRYDAKSGCVYSCIEGEVDKETIEEYAVEIVKVLQEHSCLRSLNDMRKAKVKLSTMEIYDLPIYLENLEYDRLVKRAIVVSQDFEDYRFYETVSHNYGHLVEIFSDSDKFNLFRDMEKAKEWLGIEAKPE
ncbi:MAG: hypothetical protein ACYTFM_13140 [Planctomycetota bacterium]|jgi:predicted nucleotidyltransferase